MPISNTTPDNYVLGKGRFYFAQRDASGVLGGYRFVGNVPSFSLTPSSDNLTHVSSTGGINVTDRDIQTSSDLAIGFTTDNMVAENKALFMSGTADQVTVTSATGKTTTIASGKLTKGLSYGVGVTEALPRGDKDITVTTIVQGATTLVAGTDYVVNSQTGLIFFPTTGAALETGTTVITYNLAASSKTIVNGRSNTITGAVKFISDNPDTGKGKVDYEYHLPYVRLSADGDWGLIGEDWQSFGFTGSVLQQYDGAGNPIPRFTETPLTPAP